MEGSSSRRSRSRSPPRRAPRGSRGFRWKDKSRPNDDSYSSYDSRRDRDRDRDYGGGRRDYRDRSRDRGRDRHEGRQRSPSPRRHESGSKDKGGEVKRGVGDKIDKNDKNDKKDKKGKKDKKAPKPTVAAGQEFIIVHINDRLGTKSAIPCLPSDTVGQFKLMIAARIGREAGQIMLRRQGERPFKDHITLEDYGISNGVQLDLEVDTGD
ncbi:ubiquitin-like protein [Trichoderma ceciliae]